MIPVLIVPVLSRTELLYEMLESIDERVDILAVIDNGGHVSRHRMAEINRDRIGRRYVWKMPRNLGVPTSWNLGIKATPFAPWWMVANFDVTFPAGALAKFAAESGPDRVVLSAASSAWCVFTVGENVITRVGLFDEGLHPAYFEDADYLRRCKAHGVDIFCSGILVDHKTSSTIESGYKDHNARTFGANQSRYNERRDTNDLTSGEWSLATRRALTWD
jgi:GT2 family glycosyltransferase